MAHSARSATVGLTFVARRAGSQQASSVAAVRLIPAPGVGLAVTYGSVILLSSGPSALTCAGDRLSTGIAIAWFGPIL